MFPLFIYDIQETILQNEYGYYNLDDLQEYNSLIIGEFIIFKEQVYYSYKYSLYSDYKYINILYLQKQTISSISKIFNISTDELVTRCSTHNCGFIWLKKNLNRLQDQTNCLLKKTF